MLEQMIPHNAWVVVGDGRKALFFRNEGNPTDVHLHTVQVLTNPAPDATREQGTDRPGRLHQRTNAAGEIRGSIAQTDWHDLAEERFTDEVSEALAQRCESGEIDKLVLIAPPRALANLRKALAARVHDKIIAEIDKDLTRHPVPEIERLLNA